MSKTNFIRNIILRIMCRTPVELFVLYITFISTFNMIINAYV